MTSMQSGSTAPRFADMLPDRAGRLSWITRLFLQRPIVVQLSQATEWDNDVPPYPILAGEVARAERRGSPQ
jgi:hypothetical protein